MPFRPVSERAVVFLITAVQLVNVLDFVMVLPLGPDFAQGLGIPMSHIGTIGGSYTAAASVAGLVGTYFLDRFDRRRALVVAMLGLVLSTAAGGLATGLLSLLGARLLAGLFGGPATSLAMAIIADFIPVERRGRALGAVMGAFAVASVAGVPAALEVARVGGWSMPFFLVAALGLVVVAGAAILLPPVRGHLEGSTRAARPIRVRELLSRLEVRLSYTMTAVAMMAGYLVIPHMSTYLQKNLGYPRERLGLVYLVGGLVSLVALRVAGKLVDRLGSFRMGTVSTVLYAAVLYVFLAPPSWLPILVLVSAFFLATAVRTVAYNTLTSRVPEGTFRARFMSLQSAVQHLASALGAFLSAQLLADLPGGRLGYVERVVLLSVAFTLMLPLLFFLVERRVHAREQSAGLRPVP